MKKVKMVLLVIVAVALVSTVAVAGDLNCRLDGDDVIVPDRVIQAITDFDPNKPVYAACDVNGWFVYGIEKASGSVLKSIRMVVLKSIRMVKEKDGSWRARGMRNKQFNPAQLELEEDGKCFFNVIDCEQLYHSLPPVWYKPKGGEGAIYFK